MDRVMGVLKAYTTRVGEGPLPTENSEIADMLHALGREFGATTGRPRRCGWFDAVATRHATMVNGIDELAVTNVDGSIRSRTFGSALPTAWASSVRVHPERRRVLSRCEPVYLDFPGWRKSTTKARRWMDLPAPCRTYLKALAELTGAKLSIVSVGPSRDQTLFL